MLIIKKIDVFSEFINIYNLEQKKKYGNYVIYQNIKKEYLILKLIKIN